MTMSRSLLFALCFAFLSGLTYSGITAASTETQKAVLVTGASSGIGKMITETLAARGYFVYAGARKAEDLAALNLTDNVQSIRLDVTVQEEIDAAVRTINKQGRGLHGLVNNAGVLTAGPLLETDAERIEWLFNVNVLGVHRVTSAFAPLIIENKGRIVMIGSIAGNIGIKFLGAYSMSKHATEAYTDALAAELSAFGVQVSIVSPGDFSSNIWDREIQKAKASGLVDEGSPYKEDVAKWIASVDAMETRQPAVVAEAVQHALFDEQSRRRYLVLPNRGEAEWVIGSAVTRLAELNTDQEFAYTADELAAMLKEIMEQSSVD